MSELRRCRWLAVLWIYVQVLLVRPCWAFGLEDGLELLTVPSQSMSATGGANSPGRLDIPHVIIVAGPGDGVYGPNDVQNLAEGMRHLSGDRKYVDVVGDGLQTVTVDSIRKAFQNQNLKGRRKILIVLAFGQAGSEGYSIRLGEMTAPWTPFTKVLAAGSTGGKPYELLLMAGTTDKFKGMADNLPAKSVVATLGYENVSAPAPDVKSFFVTLRNFAMPPRLKLTVRFMLALYLTKSLQTRILPGLYVSGKRKPDLQQVLSDCMTDIFTAKQTDRISKELAFFMSPEEANDTMQMVSHLVSNKRLPRDLRPSEWGRAMAEALIWEKYRDESRASPIIGE